MKISVLILILIFSLPVWAAEPETATPVFSESAGPDIASPNNETPLELKVNPEEAFNPQETFNIDDFQTLDAMFSLYQPYLKNFSGYKPLYFLVGADPEKSKDSW